MKSMYHNSFFILLIGVAITSLEASNEQMNPHYNDPESSLEKCVKRLEVLQAHFGLNIVPLRKISTLEDCSDTIESIFNNIPSPVYHPSQMLFAPRSDLAYIHSKEFRIPSPDENSSKRNLGKNFAFQSLYSKYIYPRTKSISGKLTDAGLTESQRFANPGSMEVNDIFNRPENLRSVEYNERALNSALKPGESLLNRLTSIPMQPKTFNSVGILKERKYEAPESVLDGEVSLTNKIPMLKRRSGKWFNVVNTDVAKRRRQTLSINNALMALTDMVMEHGREKLMRNRDNLRYHMLVQG